ncbi:uncharacterized protein BXZ73DRAFT_86925 [Epithele typhae]|uniref:uncharacterized protein n=1 Tax=Epithele typhae TaxID=378194 RepID=UPI002008DBC7|nr:uncharacterized protein BXZ73DRAFT_86925 [Epithele typhae]KAH9945453.1 hypothetical protein BXZ73DRAFT_86925 [Epithele typhae]
MSQAAAVLLAEPQAHPPQTNTAQSAASYLSSELADLALQGEEGIRKFQSGELPEQDAQWWRLVPQEARDVLSEKEVKRQNVLFELIHSEMEYVSDLQLVKDVFINPIIDTVSIPQSRARTFINEVFFNMEKILAHHQRMLDRLFERQLEQFPLVQSVTDIIMHYSLEFSQEYETYIKHYPIAEMRHRSELRRNQRYQDMLQQCAQDPRVRKRDIITFLSRPVTRLPRLELLLRTILKHTEPDHPDADEIPVALTVYSQVIKSTQPGIQAAEEKVKCWTLCESLVYQKGEIIDLDLYDATRSLIHQGPLARRYSKDLNMYWADLHVALLDHYLLLLKPDIRHSERVFSIVKHHMVSRPIPLDYLRLGMFDGSPEHRKEVTHGTGLFRKYEHRTVYPLTIYHASAKMTRRYTLYASSEGVRQQWHSEISHALNMRRIRQENNMLFAPSVLSDNFFKRVANTAVNLSTNAVIPNFTGYVSAVTKFSSGSHRFLAVACSTGVYVSQIDKEPSFRKVLTTLNSSCLIALPAVNKFLILSDQGLFAYSLELVGRAALGSATSQTLEASRERVASDAILVRAGRIGHRLVVLYTAKSFLQTCLYALEIVNTAEASPSLRRRGSGLFSFRSFGEPITIPKDTHGIAFLNRRIVVCSDKSLLIADPSNLTLSARHTAIPDFSDADSANNLPMGTLKTRCAAARPLGVVRCDKSDELLIVYDEIGCYTDKFGVPSRSSGYLRWESKAAAYALRGEHLLLFSPEFVEVRTVRTGKLVQTIAAEDVRRVDVGLLSADREPTTIVAMRGQEEQGLVVDDICELVETADLKATGAAQPPEMWDDFDTM